MTYISNVRLTGRAKYKNPSQAVVVPPVDTDPFFNNVTLLLQPTTSDTTVVDKSLLNNTITNGNVSLSTTSSINGKSLDFTGSATSKYLALAGAGVTDFGTGDYTVEAWTQVPVKDTGRDNVLFDTVNHIAMVRLGSSGGSFGFAYAGVFFSIEPNYPVNEWFHVAYTRQSTAVRTFLNGVELFSGTNTQSLSNASIAIGNSASTFAASNNYDGLIQSFRITKGVARYTANFTPVTVFATE